MKKYITKLILGGCAFMLVVACQELDRPEFGDYPVDTAPVGGPLKFYVAFDGAGDNALRNAVDSVRAKFPVSNQLTVTAGVTGNAAKGAPYKYIKYTSANDFAANAASFTVSVWAKKGQLKTDQIFSLPTVSGYSGQGGSMFLLTEGSVATPVLKFYVKDSKGDKFFEWVGGNSAQGIYDNNFHHLAFVYSDQTSAMTLYVDGVANAFVPVWTGHGKVTFEPAKITGLKIGAGPLEFTPAEITANADNYLKNSYTGEIDQFRMYSTALTLAEIKTLFTKKK